MSEQLAKGEMYSEVHSFGQRAKGQKGDGKYHIDPSLTVLLYEPDTTLAVRDFRVPHLPTQWQQGRSPAQLQEGT